MSSFVSGAVGLRLFSSVTSGLMGFSSAVALSQGGGVINGVFVFNGQPFAFADKVYRAEPNA